MSAAVTNKEKPSAIARRDFYHGFEPGYIHHTGNVLIQRLTNERVIHCLHENFDHWRKFFKADEIDSWEGLSERAHFELTKITQILYKMSEHDPWHKAPGSIYDAHALFTTYKYHNNQVVSPAPLAEGGTPRHLYPLPDFIPPKRVKGFKVPNTFETASSPPGASPMHGTPDTTPKAPRYALTYYYDSTSGGYCLRPCRAYEPLV